MSIQNCSFTHSDRNELEAQMLEVSRKSSRRNKITNQLPSLLEYSVELERSIGFGVSRSDQPEAPQSLNRMFGLHCREYVKCLFFGQSDSLDCLLAARTTHPSLRKFGFLTELYRR